MVAAFRPARRAHGRDIEEHLRALTVEQYGIVLARIVARAAPAGLIRPDDLVHEIGFAEDFVQHQAQLRAHTVIDVQVQAAAVREKLPAGGQNAAHPFEVGALLQPVLKCGQFQTLFALSETQMKGIARAERRVKVDELYRAAVFIDQPVEHALGARMDKASGAAVLMQFFRAADAHRYLP